MVSRGPIRGTLTAYKDSPNDRIPTLGRRTGKYTKK
jgi:hypothetical protein